MCFYRKRVRSLFVVIFLFLFLLNESESEISKSITLSGSILEEFCSNVCNPPTNSSFTLSDENGLVVFSGKSYADSNGIYEIKGLIPGKLYNFSVTDTNFLKVTLPVQIPYLDKYNQISRDFLITPKKSGAEIFFDICPFKYRTFKIKEIYNHNLERIINLIKQNPEINFIISCFPDEDKDKEYNLFLTINRCNALKNLFISRGIANDRLSIEPNAKTDPMFPPPYSRESKGRRYNGSTYLIIK